MRSGNPTLSEGVLRDIDYSRGVEETMTTQGAVNKTAILILLCIASAAYVWHRFEQTQDPASISFLMIGGAIVGFILAIVTVFKMDWAPVTAPIYALAQGLFLGGISAIFELQYPGIAFQAVLITFGVLLSMLGLYSSGVIKVTDKFRTGVMAATFGIVVIYLLTMILGFFGVQIPYIHQTGTIGILFSLFVIVVAALNLVLDFDLINTLAARNAPKRMEWYGAFALMVTLVWLYLEVLRLLAKIRGRD